ncbi:MAG: hypothetical protein QOG69_2499 [Actinomycetota bacterium]|jgi:quercetin dioxygenase-like cupin family protein|nr:hypothetical protein [Actinomycetota bacterium]
MTTNAYDLDARPEPPIPASTRHSFDRSTGHSTDPGVLLRWAATIAAAPDLTEWLAPGATERSWIPLATPSDWDAWLIVWPAGSATGWHDHQGAAGVFYVARGRLTEFSLAGGPSAGGSTAGNWTDVRTRRVPPGRGRVFGANHVHHVVNEYDEPAYSVHVYAPRLRGMTRYGWQDDALVTLGSEPAGNW